jgi:hypothetical protein
VACAFLRGEWNPRKRPLLTTPRRASRTPPRQLGLLEVRQVDIGCVHLITRRPALSRSEGPSEGSTVVRSGMVTRICGDDRRPGGPIGGIGPGWEPANRSSSVAVLLTVRRRRGGGRVLKRYSATRSRRGSDANSARRVSWRCRRFRRPAIEPGTARSLVQTFGKRTQCHSALLGGTRWHSGPISRARGASQ